METILTKLDGYLQTLSSQEVVKLKEGEYYQTIFNSLLKFLEKITTDDIIFLNRILEFYLYPQNFNDLSYGCLYRDSIYMNFDLDYELTKFKGLGVIREVSHDNDSYQIFEEHIEIFLKREIVLSEIIEEID